MTKKYYQFVSSNQESSLYIYDDITNEGTSELIKELEEMKDTKVVYVYINSFGGDVGGGLALYNALKRHPAKIITVNDGLMASAATIPFCAGDERVVSRVSAGLIHQAWTCAEGNAKDFSKYAEDLKVLTQGSVEVYKSVMNITEEEILSLMEEERWLSPDEMLALGMATEIKELERKGVQQSMKLKVLELLMASQKEEKTEKNIDLDDDEVKVIEKLLGKKKRIKCSSENEESDLGDEEAKVLRNLAKKVKSAVEDNEKEIDLNEEDAKTLKELAKKVRNAVDDEEETDLDDKEVEVLGKLVKKEGNPEGFDNPDVEDPDDDDIDLSEEELEILKKLLKKAKKKDDWVTPPDEGDGNKGKPSQLWNGFFEALVK